MREGHSEAREALEESRELGNGRTGSTCSKASRGEAFGHARCENCKAYLSQAFTVKRKGKRYCVVCAAY